MPIHYIDKLPIPRQKTVQWGYKVSKMEFGIPDTACCANCKDKAKCQLELECKLGWKEAREWQAELENIHCCLCWKEA